MVFLIAVAAVLFVIVLGVVLAWAVARFDGAVQSTKNQIGNKGKNYNPAVTLGYAIDLSVAADRQVKEARLLAAKKAAVTPRGANIRIGRLGHATLKTAAKGIEDDPWTAAKIAQFHGWDGVRTGYVAAAAVAAAPTAVSVPKPTLTEITDEMPPAEKRKARVANAKANSAYKKALKAAGGGAKAAQPTAVAAPTASVPAAAANVPPPQLIEITDDMPPEEKRKARVANAKAKSAYKKALKAAGVDPKAAAAPVAAVPAAAPPPAAAVPANAPPPPDLTEITDGMAPDEIRRARISNAKAKSAYKKALKEAGIDPATVM